VIVALAFVYVILSVICSGVQELLAGFLKLRARDLDAGIRNLLCDDDLADRVLVHPLLKVLGSTRRETTAARAAAGEEADRARSAFRSPRRRCAARGRRRSLATDYEVRGTRFAWLRK